MTAKTILMVVAAFALTAGPSSGQQVHDDGPLQQPLSNLRTCFRSNAAEVYALGIRATRDAEEILLKWCNPLNDLFASIKINEGTRPKLPAVPPGIFRITAREEWVAFLNSASGK